MIGHYGVVLRVMLRLASYEEASHFDIRNAEGRWAPAEYWHYGINVDWRIMPHFICWSGIWDAIGIYLLTRGENRGRSVRIWLYWRYDAHDGDNFNLQRSELAELALFRPSVDNAASFNGNWSTLEKWLLHAIIFVKAKCHLAITSDNRAFMRKSLRQLIDSYATWFRFMPHDVERNQSSMAISFVQKTPSAIHHSI